MNWKDKIAVMLAAVMLAVIGVQGVASAVVTPPRLTTVKACTVEADKNPMTGKVKVTGRNPQMINVRKGDMAGVFGDGTVTCKRDKGGQLKDHNRIYTSAVIEKWRPQYKKYFTYRTYAYSQSWGKSYPEIQVFPAASIICDGPGHYRVRVQAWTADTTVPISAYPSPFVEEASQQVGLCVGTNHKTLAVVNNP